MISLCSRNVSVVLVYNIIPWFVFLVLRPWMPVTKYSYNISYFMAKCHKLVRSNFKKARFAKRPVYNAMYNTFYLIIYTTRIFYMFFWVLLSRKECNGATFNWIALVHLNAHWMSTWFTIRNKTVCFKLSLLTFIAPNHNPYYGKYHKILNLLSTYNLVFI